MKTVMALVSAVALTMTAINSQAQNPESQPTFTYQITSVEKVSADLKIEGTIRNTGPTPINYLFVTSIGYNSNHEIIGTGNSIPVIGFSLVSNQIVYFQTEILNDTAQEIASYSINFVTRSTPNVSPTPFVVDATPEPVATPASSITYKEFPRNTSPTPESTVEATPTPTKEQLAEWEAEWKKEAQENYRKAQQERIEQEKQHRELLLKQEAERESHGDFSQAPGLTPEQKQEAEIKWAEKNAAESIKGATPAPQ